MSDFEEADVLRAAQSVYESHLQESRTGPVAEQLLGQLLKLSGSPDGFVWEAPARGDDWAAPGLTRACSRSHLDAWVESVGHRLVSLDAPRLASEGAHPELFDLLRAQTPSGIAAPGSVLTVPLTYGGGTVGLVGLLDPAGGDAQELIEHLAPLFRAGASVLFAVRSGAPQSAASLRQMQKADAIGFLASSVAHDLNNCLYVMLGNSELGLKKGGEENPLAKYFKEILNAARRGMQVSERLLAYRRLSTFGESLCELAPVLEEARELFPLLLPSSIELVIEDAPEGVVLALGAADLQQVLLALSWNAAKAIPVEGTIRFGVEVFAGRADGGSGDRVRITVTDDGEGMEGSVVEAAFEPGFTTKPGGKGAGLGLSVVRGIVEAASGRVSLRSEVGRGTEVEVEFPCERRGRESDF